LANHPFLSKILERIVDKQLEVYKICTIPVRFQGLNISGTREELGYSLI